MSEYQPKPPTPQEAEKLWRMLGGMPRTMPMTFRCLVCKKHMGLPEISVGGPYGWSDYCYEHGRDVRATYPL